MGRVVLPRHVPCTGGTVRNCRPVCKEGPGEQAEFEGPSVPSQGWITRRDVLESTPFLLDIMTVVCKNQMYLSESYTK